MRKCLFMLHHLRYDQFLEDLQELGVVHVGRSLQSVASDEAATLNEELSGLEKSCDFLIKYHHSDTDTDSSTGFTDPRIVYENTTRLKKTLDDENAHLGQIKKNIETLSQWGNFSPEIISMLKKEGINVRFFSVHAKKYRQEWIDQEAIEIISNEGNKIRFVYVGKDHVDFKHAVPENLPSIELLKLYSQKDTCLENIKACEISLSKLAVRGLRVVEDRMKQIRTRLEWLDVRQNLTNQVVEGKVFLLEGWVPKPEEDSLARYLEDHHIYYTSEKPGPGDHPPVKLKNSRLGKLFEPVTRLFALPEYRELDLTIYFAPFFMLFFGFCLGDAGYGLVLLAGSTIGKRFASEKLKGFLTLGQLFGASTFVMGMVFGTFFGIELSGINKLGTIKDWFLDSSQIFTLSLIIGGIQIVYGIVLRIFNQLRQESPLIALSSGGWLLLVLTIAYTVITAENESGILLPGIIKNALYAISLFLIVFFTATGPLHLRIVGGIWGIYNTVTGIFGDLLSYIRLFALGIASSILGLVINQMAISFGEAKYVGPVIFFLIVVIGHTANLAISSLGAFVHPMRLTFVEFYKNAGFRGTGKPFIPFSKKNK